MTSPYSHLGQQIVDELERSKPIYNIEKNKLKYTPSHLRYKTNVRTVSILKSLRKAIKSAGINDDDEWVSKLPTDSLYLLYLVKYDARINTYFGAMIDRMDKIDGLTVKQIKTDIEFFMKNRDFRFSDLTKVPLIGAPSGVRMPLARDAETLDNEYKERIQIIFGKLVKQDRDAFREALDKFIERIITRINFNNRLLDADDSETLDKVKATLFGVFFWTSFGQYKKTFGNDSPFPNRLRYDIINETDRTSIYDIKIIKVKKTLKSFTRDAEVKKILLETDEYDEGVYNTDEMIDNGLFYTRGTRKPLEPLSPLQVGSLYSSFVIDLYVWIHAGREITDLDRDIHNFDNLIDQKIHGMDVYGKDILLVRYLCYFAPHIEIYSDDDMFTEISRLVTFWLSDVLNGIESGTGWTSNYANEDKRYTQRSHKKWKEWRISVMTLLCRIVQNEVETILYPQVYDDTLKSGVYSDVFEPLWDGISDGNLYGLNIEKVIALEIKNKKIKLSKDGTRFDAFSKPILRPSTIISQLVSPPLSHMLPPLQQKPISKTQAGILSLNSCIGLFMNRAVIAQTLHQLGSIEPIIYNNRLQDKIQQYRDKSGEVTIFNRRKLVKSLGIDYKEPVEFGKHIDTVTLIALVLEWKST